MEAAQEIHRGAFTTVDVIVLVVYFVGMAALGPLFRDKAKTTEGYFLGDRSFPGWLIGFSMFATSISSLTFIGYPADAYKTAWYRMTPSYALPLAVIIASYYFLPFFRRGRVTSAYEYLEARFGPKTRLYAAIAFTLNQITRLSLILYLISVLVHEVTGLDPYLSILLGGVVTSFYTVMGGIRAVLWTDFIQSFVLWAGGLIAIAVVLYHVPGGLAGVITSGAVAHKFSMYDINAAKELAPVKWAPDFTQATVTLFFLVGLGNWLAEYSSNQTVIQRYLASKDARQARIAMWVCCLCSVPTWIMFMFLGTCLWAFYNHFPNPAAQAMLAGVDAAGNSVKPEGILPLFIIQELPQGLTGLVIAGVLAAAMSSLSSSINSVSAVSIVDIYRRHVAPDRDDSHYVRVAKLIGWVLTAIMIFGAIFLMRSDTKTLLDTGTVLTAVTGGGLLGLYFIGFFTTVGDDRSMLPGIAVTVFFTAWMTFATFPGLLPEFLVPPIHKYYIGLIGHALMFTIGIGMAYLLPRRPRDLHNLTVWTQDDSPLT